MKTMTRQHNPRYYVPAPSWWPLIGSVTLLLMASGFVVLLQEHKLGAYIMAAGALILAYMLTGWFGTVIRESVS